MCERFQTLYIIDHKINYQQNTTKVIYKINHNGGYITNKKGNIEPRTGNNASIVPSIAVHQCGIEREMKKFYRNIYYPSERHFKNLDTSLILHFENKYGAPLYR